MYLKIFLSGLLALVIQHAFKIYFMLDLGKHVYNHYPGSCHKVEGIGYGSEDFYMLPNGLAFITSGFSLSDNNPSGFSKFIDKHKIKGRIYMFDMKGSKNIAQELSLQSSKDFDKERFFPHGISGWQDKASGKVYLFVVNHEKNGPEKVEKFLVSMETYSLTHIKSYLGDDTFTLVNDVVATGLDSFYYTNSVPFSGYYGRVFAILSMMPWGTVGYCEGTNCRQVADGLAVANGVHMSKDGRYVYAAEVQARALRIYSRKEDNSLTLKETYHFDTAPDNIMVDPVTSNLYIGMHPVGYQIMAHLDNPEVRSPSQILHVKLKEGSVTSVTQLFADDGNLITGSSVGVVYNKKLLIGSVINSLVYCDIMVPM